MTIDGDEVGRRNGSMVQPAGMPAQIPVRRHRAHRKSVIRRAAYAGRDAVISLRRWYLRNVLKMDLHPTCKFSLKANFDTTNPRGVHIGAGTYVAFGAVILSHDMSRLVSAHTTIGRNCFVGARSIVMPGITIGDECIIGSGAVVTRDVPSHSVVVGNPAKVVKSGIRTREWGILVEEYEAARERVDAERALPRP